MRNSLCNGNHWEKQPIMELILVVLYVKITLFITGFNHGLPSNVKYGP